MYYLPQAEGVLMRSIDPQMDYLPQAEGVLLRALDDRSRVRG